MKGFYYKEVKTPGLWIVNRKDILGINLPFEKGLTVLEQVLKGDAPMIKLLREYTYTLQKVSSGLGDSQHQKDLLALTQKMDELEAWTLESEVKSILTRLGIIDFEADVSTLSGGQRKRIAMASALINPVDLLILDEPTNHIDNDAVDCLEQYLSKQKGALLMVTHDRYFLERVCNRIIELDRGNLYSYQANYSKYLEMKAEREEIEKGSQNKRQRFLKKELEWIRAGVKAPFVLCQKVLPYIRKSEHAAIINISSTVGHKGYVNQAAYAASKHAVLGFSKSLANEVYTENIRVHTICPGGMYTYMVKIARPDLKGDDMITPDEIADIILFLLQSRGNAVIDEICVHRSGKKPFDI